ncbi:hypothetical protein Tco_0645621 [Tanacetum coccineum]
MKDKMVYKGDNIVGALMNVPIFVGTFSIMTDFAVLEDMDAYRDEGMGDIIVGDPFLRKVGIKTKCLEGIITLYNGDDEVAYQILRSHPRFKNHTNEQCNKIPPLLKVWSENPNLKQAKMQVDILDVDTLSLGAILSFLFGLLTTEAAEGLIGSLSSLCLIALKRSLYSILIAAGFVQTLFDEQKV